MSSVEKFNHPYHIFERSKDNKIVYRCNHPDCPYYNRKALLLGKRAECPKCHELFILTNQKLRLKLPTCDLCSKSPKAQILKEARMMTELVINDESQSEALPDDIRSLLE